MRSQERTLSVPLMSTEMLQLAKENSEILQQYLQDHQSASLRLEGAEDRAIPLPDPILRLVYEALVGAAAGKRLRLVTEDEEVSPAQAAAFLRVPRPYLAKLLDTGAIPYVGTQRRMTMADLIAYQRRRKGKEALQRMVELSEEMGLYDE